MGAVRRAGAAAAAMITTGVLAAPAAAFVVEERGGLATATAGAVLGPDGRLWVAEQGSDSVVRLDAVTGAIVDRFLVGAGPARMAVGPGGRVWVAVRGAGRLVWFDATSPSPTVHPVPTGGANGPVAIVAGPGDRMSFSLPGTDCGFGSRLGSVAADGSDLQVPDVPTGQAFDLAVSGGKLFAPIACGGSVARRTPTTMAAEAFIRMPDDGRPTGITADATGTLWTTLSDSGAVARFPAGAADGSEAVAVRPAQGTLDTPSGITVGEDGRVYAGAVGQLARIDPATSAVTLFPTVPGALPLTVARGAGGDLVLTDSTAPRTIRFVNGAPRVDAAAVAADGTATATVDPRGNATEVVFDVGPTTDYGTSTAPRTIPAGTVPVAVSAALDGLAPGTTYHVRARATNAEGTTLGPDLLLATPPAAPPVLPPAVVPPAVVPGALAPARVAAKAVFRFRPSKTTTRVLRAKLTGLAGGETAKLSCTGKGCPKRATTRKALARGSRSLTSVLAGRRLAPGAKVRLTLTRPGRTGVVRTWTIRRAKQPKLATTCLPPGATAARACG